MTVARTSKARQSRLLRQLILVVSFCALGIPHAVAQAPLGPSSRTIAEGWNALAAGDLVAAGRAADRALQQSAGNVQALALAVEIEIVGARGAVPGLDAYERWLGSRRVEAPYGLRQVAGAHLRRIARQAQHPARVEAAQLLAEDGDLAFLTELSAAPNADPNLLAAVQDERSVTALLTQLQSSAGGKLRVIEALGRSGSPRAVAPLQKLLDDPRIEDRAAAAEALGRLGAREAIPRLRTLLDEQAFPVRMAAATALYQMDDLSGVQMLEQLLSSDHPAVRLAAAEAMSVRAEGAWMNVARNLAAERDETVRLGAARLLARHDPVLAAQTLQSLERSENPAVREEAARLFVADVSADFGGLRRALRSPDGVAAVRAAGRILELTR